MTDPRIPDDDGRLDDLGLETLSDGVHPSRSQWTAIESAAAQRRQRRTWLLAVAAMVVLVVGTAAVLVGRSGREGSDVGTGFASSATPWAIPPAGADVAWVTQEDGLATITYTIDGREYFLHQSHFQADATQTSMYQEAVDSQRAQLNGTTVDDPTLGTVELLCSVLTRTGVGSADAPLGTVQTAIGSARGPTAATWTIGTSTYFLTPNPTGSESTDCGADDPDLEGVLTAARALRYVDDATWEAFVAEHPQEGGVVAPATTATTAPPPEEAPADRASAVDQITAAVAAWSAPAADGSFPNLEDGTAKAPEYTELFDTAAKQSGAAQAGDGSGNASRLSRVRFVTPERASITMELTAKLPTGTFTFPQEGEAILQDGHWVVTYRTVITTLRRACIPPGGYDGCPTGN
jgi:hypothetical protein